MILKELKIKAWIGDATNCYIIQDEKSKETMVIDPAGNVDQIVEMLDILQAKLKYIYLTHCHGDHIGCIKELPKELPLYMGKLGRDIQLALSEHLSYEDETQNMMMERLNSSRVFSPGLLVSSHFRPYCMG